MPVLLDRGPLPAIVGRLIRVRPSGQGVLVALLTMAFVAIAAARLSGGSPPPTARGPSPSATVAALASAPPPSAAGPSSAVAATPAAATPAPTLPATAAGRTYRVKPGDTLYAIARRFGTTVGTIQRLNGLGKSTTLHSGQVLKLP